MATSMTLEVSCQRPSAAAAWNWNSLLQKHLQDVVYVLSQFIAIAIAIGAAIAAYTSEGKLIYGTVSS